VTEPQQRALTLPNPAAILADVRWTSRLFGHDSRLRAAALGPLVAIAPCDQGIYVVVGWVLNSLWWPP